MGPAVAALPHTRRSRHRVSPGPRPPAVHVSGTSEKPTPWLVRFSANPTTTDDAPLAATAREPIGGGSAYQRTLGASLELSGQE